jgi:peptidoglycan-associated lipoprotein
MDISVRAAKLILIALLVGVLASACTMRLVEKSESDGDAQGSAAIAALLKKPRADKPPLTLPSPQEGRGEKAEAAVSSAVIDEQPRPLQAEAPEPALPTASPAGALVSVPVFFDFDSAAIRADAADTLTAVFEGLQELPAARVRIEGNCDERGAAGYNAALGLRRADSAKEFLVRLGVPPSRMQTVSNGEAAPLCADHNEACWTRNRRGDIIIELTHE